MHGARTTYNAEELKVIVVGNGEVGKTSMIRRFCTGEFTGGYKKTIGVDFLERELYVRKHGTEVRMMLWDTAGQEEYDAITRTYYRGAAACVFVFSTTDEASLEAIPKWFDKVTCECGTDIAMVLVQNKVDLLDEARVSASDAEHMADRLKVKLYRSCVKENVNIGEVFEYLAGRALDATSGGGAARNEHPSTSSATAAASMGGGGGGGGGSMSTRRAQSSGDGMQPQHQEPHYQHERQQGFGDGGGASRNGDGTGSAASTPRARVDDEDGNEPPAPSPVVNFNQPSKRRTGGKKSRACSII